MPPNLLAQYLYLWKLTAVRQALETAWVSASVRQTFIELLVPAGSSSSLGSRGGAAGDDQRLGALRTHRGERLMILVRPADIELDELDTQPCRDFAHRRL